MKTFRILSSLLTLVFSLPATAFAQGLIPAELPPFTRELNNKRLLAEDKKTVKVNDVSWFERHQCPYEDVTRIQNPEYLSGLSYGLAYYQTKLEQKEPGEYSKIRIGSIRIEEGPFKKDELDGNSNYTFSRKIKPGQKTAESHLIYEPALDDTIIRAVQEQENEIARYFAAHPEMKDYLVCTRKQTVRIVILDYRNGEPHLKDEKQCNGIDTFRGAMDVCITLTKEGAKITSAHIGFFARLRGQSVIGETKGISDTNELDSRLKDFKKRKKTFYKPNQVLPETAPAPGPSVPASPSKTAN